MQTFNTETQVIATGVSFDDYMTTYAAQFTEWVDGTVIKMSPIHERHDGLSQFFYMLLNTYLSETGGGRVLQAPMVMKPGDEFPAREPDLQVLLPDQLGLLKGTIVAGASALVIEIISPESAARDAGTKLFEYERAGVREYWLIDPIRREASFFVLAEDNLYHRHNPGTDGFYQSTVLSQFRLSVSILWQDELPTGRAIVALVDEILSGN
jgi:Uma2 family endonuclease